MAQNYLNQSDIVHIKNFGTDIIQNLFLKDYMRYVLNWDTSNSDNKSIYEKNIFAMNIGYLQTIVLKGSRKVMNRNFIVNPGNNFEIVVLPNYPVRNTDEQFDVRYTTGGAMELEKAYYNALEITNHRLHFL